jgi:hypothetical protein
VRNPSSELGHPDFKVFYYSPEVTLVKRQRLNADVLGRRVSGFVGLGGAQMFSKAPSDFNVRVEDQILGSEALIDLSTVHSTNRGTLLCVRPSASACKLCP